MTIGPQGTWSVSVKSKDASRAQRFAVDGAGSGNGTSSGTTATPAILVSGGSAPSVERAAWRGTIDLF